MEIIVVYYNHLLACVVYIDQFETNEINVPFTLYCMCIQITADYSPINQFDSYIRLGCHDYSLENLEFAFNCRLHLELLHHLKQKQNQLGHQWISGLIGEQMSTN